MLPQQSWKAFISTYSPIIFCLTRYFIASVDSSLYDGAGSQVWRQLPCCCNLLELGRGRTGPCRVRPGSSVTCSQPSLERSHRCCPACWPMGITQGPRNFKCLMFHSPLRFLRAMIMSESMCLRRRSVRVTPSGSSILTSSRNSVQIFGLRVKRCLKCCLILSGLSNKTFIIDILLKIIFFAALSVSLSLLELSRTDLGHFSP